MEENGKIYYVTGIDNSQMKQDAENSKRILHDIGKEGAAAGEDIDTAMKKVGVTIASVFSAKMMTEFIAKIITVRSEIQNLEISFETLLGNKDKAAALLGEIREFAVKTPMMIKDLANGAKTMLSFNIETQKVMPTLRAIGDISMGDAAKFQSLTLAFSQMSSTGKLMGQDLLQMINAGFNPLAEISERTGKSLKTLKDEMANGRITADMVSQAFMDATSEGGKFYGMLEKQSHGLTGSISNLKGAIDDMMNELGEKMQDSVSGVIQYTTELVHNYKKVGDALAVLVAGYGAYKAAVIATNLVLKATAFADNIRLVMMFRKELGLLRAAQQAFNITAAQNPYALIATAVIAATTAIVRFVKRKREEKQAIIDSTKEMRDEYTQTNMLIGKLKDANLKEEERRKILEQLKQVNPDIVQGIADEATAYEKLNERLDEYNKKQLAAIAVRQFSKREDFDDVVEDFADARDKMESVNADMISLWSTIYDRYLEMREKGVGINPSVASMMESLTVSSESEAYKVEAVFSAWREMEERINQSHGAYSGYMDGRVELQNLLSGLSDQDFQKATKKLDKLEGVYSEKAEAMKTKIEQIALSIYATDETARQEFIDSQMAIYFPETRKQVPEPHEEEQGEKKNKAYWENFKKQKEEELAALEDAELTSKKALQLRRQIAEAEIKIAAYSVSYKDDSRYADETAERRSKTQGYVQARKEEAQKAEFEIRQAAINAQHDGFERQIQQAQLDYDMLIAANEERKRQMVERLMDERLNEWMINNPKATKEQQIAFRMTVTEKDLTQDQKDILKRYSEQASEIQRKANQQALKDMLSDYRSYENKRLSIQENFSRIIAEMEKSLEAVDENGELIIKDENERLIVQEAIILAKQKEADALLELDAKYGALNKAAQERNRLEQQLTVLQGKLYEALQNENNADEVVNLRAEIEKLRKKIKEIDDATQEATKTTKSLADAWKEMAEEIKNADIPTQLNAVGSFMEKMAEVEGTNGFSFLGKLVSGIATMDISKIADAFIEDYEKNMERVNAVAEAKMQARLEAIRAHYDELLSGSGNIFGDDMLQGAQQYVQVLREIEHRNQYAAARRAFGNKLDVEKILAGDYTGYNKEAVDRAMGYNNEKITFRTDKTFLGLFDEYMSFKDLSEQLGIELYDKYGNLNAELAQKILDTYENELQPGEKEFLNQVIQDSEAYQEAMDGVANYISDLFGNVAEGIADDFINSFLESGQAAIDFGSVVSDVAKQMVKDLVKSKILAAMDPFSEQINDIMTGDGSQEEKVAQIMAVFASMQEVMDGLTPEIQALLEGYQQFFDLGDDREGATKGIAQASQDSVDELNGRMTAVQGHTYSISENTKLLLENTQNILESVMHIEDNTGDMSSRLARVETETTRMRYTLDDLKQNGIKIK